MMSFTLELKINAYSCEFIRVPEMVYWHLASNLSSMLHIQKKNTAVSEQIQLSKCYALGVRNTGYSQEM